MSRPRKKTCRFFNLPGGCRKGNRCPDEHDSSGRGRGNGSFSGDARAVAQKVPRAPPGKCDFYWSTGSCKRAFECRFKHDLSPALLQEKNTVDGRSVDVSSESTDSLTPFLTLSGLSNMSGSGSDVFRDSSASFNPQETQQYMTLFLRDNYRFASAAQMASFAKLAAGASSANKSWTDEDGQLFLSAMASENGCLRLSNILSYGMVSSTSHYDPKVLSFQRGYLPVFQYLSSKFVIKSTLGHLVNSLYGVFHNNLNQIIFNLDGCMSAYMTARSFKEKPSSPESSGAFVFGPILTVFYEYLSRFKAALATYKELGPFVLKLGHWVEEWANGISSASPAFSDILTSPEHQDVRVLVSERLQDRGHRITSIVEREQAEMDRSAARKTERDVASASQAERTHLLQALANYYDGPGEERRDGPRHDNDFVDTSSIKVAPTDEELTCKLVPFLPANLPNAPHPFPRDSMQRLLDIQFRLLREELLAPLRTSVQVLLDDMTTKSRKTQLHELMKKKGGRYNYQDRRDSVMFNVYTNVSFSKIEMDSRRGLVVELQLDAPPGSARSNNANMRAAYWANGKRLMQGGLVAVLWKRADHVDVHLGILCSSSEKLAEAARANGDKLRVRVQFFDAVVNFKVLEHMRSSVKAKDERLLVESSVMFETIRPFLDSLKRVPETIPFEKYLPHPLSGSLSGVKIHPPAYSALPNFAFNLESLRRSEDEEGLHGLRLVATDPASIAETREALATRSRLDPSQAEAIVDALTREIALIQGPPGTGKTFMGVELIRVLIENNIGPILLIAFTNHALDHMLSSVVASGITSDIVRLGGRSSDETIKRFSIEELERASGRSYMDRAMKSEYRTIKEAEEEIMKLLKRVIGTNIPSALLLNHVCIVYPDHIERLEEPPSWIRELHSYLSHDWQESDKKGVPDTSLYAFWKTARDLAFLRDARMQKNNRKTPTVSANRFNELLRVTEETSNKRASSDGKATPAVVDDDMQEAGSDIFDEEASVPELQDVADLTDAEAFLQAHGEADIPQELVSDRPLEVLLETDTYDVWHYSASERARVNAYWVTQYRESAYESQKQRFEDLIEKHLELRQRQRNRDEEIRLNIVRNRRLIGCTTTGAAKLISLLKGFGPRVMIVEEAGQVLESHVLASLVDSAEHLVMIGDPLQLRPTLNNYALSMDNPQGRDLYRFDMSLMERLSSTGFPMSRLDVQRRMRPSISSLIRQTLYPGLIDHDVVFKYKPVRGMDRDVFFLTHGNQEHGGGDDSVSKHNPYEVSMIKDLVKYLLRQGCYSTDGSIVVLCAYLGQLAKVRDALKGEMTVVIDERDQDALAAHEGENTVDSVASIERVHVTQRVRIRSVDNYQGEEADIVILSLVRNSGEGHENNGQDIIARRTMPKIGFLKSKNRTNVALSRARQGLYILGNASDFASQSPMWGSVITQLEENDAIGEAIPIKCHRHPDDVRHISKPGELPKISPDGGCLRSCNERLSCGHNCPYKCHSDDENHRNIFCTQPCPKLCPKGHPCRKQCAEPCGDCKHPIRDVKLPCGHVHKSVPCYQMDDLSEVKCMVKVQRDLSTCEHSVQLPCSVDVRDHKCQVLCDGILPCCGKSCKAKCHACQQPLDPALLEALPRTRHCTHECGRPLYCEHACRGTCAVDHKCLNECQEKCRQSCIHAQCRLSCSTPCAPCQEPCTWNCPHYSCPVPCGSVCARLPCDLRCDKILSCGHQCPSVCGEDCTDQICLECSPKEALSAIADFIMQRPLSDLDPSQGTVEELIITLPGCKHAFTVETLDGHCQLKEYYEQSGNGVWRSLKSPEAGFKPPPTCPTCRRGIRSPRYGRVYKRADLDILERNVASRLTKSIRTATSEFDSIDKIVLRRAIEVGGTGMHFSALEIPEDKVESREKAKLKVLRVNSDDVVPVHWNALDPGKYLHGIQNDIAKQWAKDTSRVKAVYQRAFAVASTRSAHSAAWESAFASVYRQEIENAVEVPTAAPRYPLEHAMRMARMKIGLAQPRADKRFCVEAFWLTIDIRFLLADIAQAWLNPGLRRSATSSTFITVWSKFIAFVLQTCERDAGIALHIAEASQSRKQALRCRILIISTKLECLKLNYQLFQGATPAAMTREQLLETICEELDSIGQAVDHEKAIYRKSRISAMADMDFKNVFMGPADTIRKELKDLEQAVRTHAVYTPVSLEEKRQVLAGLMTSPDFRHSGHYYQCPNGHPYVIGDCGGANQTSQCPECYAPIGGTGHSLLSTNRRDTELEDLARSGGAQVSPWPWAQ